MKRIIILTTACLMVFSAGTVFGQESAENTSTVMLNGSLYDVVFAWKKKKMRATESHWAGFSFAFSNLKDLPKDVNLSLERSYSISWNVDDREVPIHPHWMLVSGLGFDWSRYHFDGNAFLKNADGVTGFYQNDRELKDSKLLVYYGKIPFLLEYQTRVHGRTFFVQGGVEGLVKLYSKSRIEVKNGSHTDKEDFRNLKIYPVNMRLFMQIGFTNLGIFGYYQPFSMFQNGYGPNLRSFGIGIAIN